MSGKVDLVAQWYRDFGPVQWLTTEALVELAARIRDAEAEARKCGFEEGKEIAALEALKWDEFDDATDHRLMLCQQITKKIAEAIRAHQP